MLDNEISMDLYSLGEFLVQCVEISKLVTTSKVGADLYRYAKVIDTSDRGFNCSSAKAILKAIEHNSRDPSYKLVLDKLKELDYDMNKLIDKKISNNKIKVTDVRN